ncbi:MAG: hypothetical protein K6G80_05120 [Treponema sp.]|nr:hypothetical protein [Treponema sp.]
MDEAAIIQGRKTFFITPDSALLPEDYLQDFLVRGYEAYIINDDRYCPIPQKVEILINTFPDSILFFYIDTQIQDLEWSDFIRKLQQKYNGKVLLGVLYVKRGDEAFKTRLEKYYLFDVGIQCGCIALEYQKNKNFALIDRVMHANQAEGRRKNVRAICDHNSIINFSVNKMGLVQGEILDVSMSHFSCVLDSGLNIKMYEKLKRMLVNINGMHFTTDAILVMTRELEDKTLYIFVFTRSDGQHGLESDIELRLAEKLYQMITGKVKDLLRQKFEQAGKELRNKYSRTYTASDRISFKI